MTERGIFISVFNVRSRLKLLNVLRFGPQCISTSVYVCRFDNIKMYFLNFWENH